MKGYYIHLLSLYLNGNVLGEILVSLFENRVYALTKQTNKQKSHVLVYDTRYFSTFITIPKKPHFNNNNNNDDSDK